MSHNTEDPNDDNYSVLSLLMTLIEEMMASLSSNSSGLIWTLNLIINIGNNLLILHQKVFLVMKLLMLHSLKMVGVALSIMETNVSLMGK